LGWRLVKLIILAVGGVVRFLSFLVFIMFLAVVYG
jgi:hypothetical protein